MLSQRKTELCEHQIDRHKNINNDKIALDSLFYLPRCVGKAIILKKKSSFDVDEGVHKQTCVLWLRLYKKLHLETEEFFSAQYTTDVRQAQNLISATFKRYAVGWTFTTISSILPKLESSLCLWVLLYLLQASLNRIYRKKTISFRSCESFVSAPRSSLGPQESSSTCCQSDARSTLHEAGKAPVLRESLLLCIFPALICTARVLGADSVTSWITSVMWPLRLCGAIWVVLSPEGR